MRKARGEHVSVKNFLLILEVKHVKVWRIGMTQVPKWMKFVVKAFQLLLLSPSSNVYFKSIKEKGKNVNRYFLPEYHSQPIPLVNSLK